MQRHRKKTPCFWTPLRLAADLAGAREQAASLTEQLAALAADKSSVEGEQASLAGQLAQLQVGRL